jgi:hypothetical protein
MQQSNTTTNEPADSREQDHAECYRALIKALEFWRDTLIENERLRAALRPFAQVARGQRLNPSPDDWQRADAAFNERIRK